jgi:hypothetical protein
MIWYKKKLEILSLICDKVSHESLPSQTNNEKKLILPRSQNGGALGHFLSIKRKGFEKHLFLYFFAQVFINLQEEIWCYSRLYL